LRRVAAALAAVALTVALAGCDDDRETPIIPGPGPSKVKVDTPELRALKAEIGMEDCAPGPGGGALPAITLPCLGGGPGVDLSSLKGPMVLSLWQAGCAPCRKEMPALQAFDQQYGDRVPVLGVDFADRYPGSALEEAGERGVTYPSLADPGGDLMDTDVFAKILGMPMMYFVDADGSVAYVQPGGVDSEEEIVDLVRDHLEVDLSTPPSSSTPPLRSSDEELVGDPGEAL
jgi:thiol-disulfide isomerase/thioredoxin